MTLLRTAAVCCGLLVSCAALAEERSAQAPPDAPTARPGWPEEKCRRYRAAWETLSARTGRRGLGPAFVERHEAFLASGCTTQGDVCPRNPEELEAANMLTIMAMNAGMSSTFLPFGCPKPAAGRS